MKRVPSWVGRLFVVGQLFFVTAIGSAAAATATPAADAGETPRRGGILRLWRNDDWRSLDPAIGFDADAAPIQKLLFRGLLNYGAGTDLVPDQALVWNVSPDGLTYTFRLRPGVRFSDGSDVEAADYIFSFERVLNPATGSPGSAYFMDIDGAAEFSQGKTPRVSGLSAPDSKTLVIRLARPVFTFRYVLAMNFAAVIPRNVVQQDPANFKYHRVGSGPYRVSHWRRSVGWRFERNPHYAGEDGLVDGVEISLGGDTSLAAMMLERGEIDWFTGDSVVATRFQKDPRLREWVHWVDTVSTEFFFMNTEMKPFDDLRVRQAFSHAIDKVRMLRVVGGRATLAQGIVPPAMPWSNPGAPQYAYDPAKARALLREAGVAEGIRIPYWFIASRPADRRVAQSIQQDLAAIGVALELNGVSYPAFEVKARNRGVAPCGTWGWVQDYPDPSTFLDMLLNGELISASDCNNVAFYNNPEFNRRLKEAAGEMDVSRRMQAYRAAESIAIQEAPWVPLYHPQYSLMVHPRVRGHVPHPVWLWRYETLWLKP